MVVVGAFTMYEGPSPPGCAAASDDKTVYLVIALPPDAGANQETVSCPRKSVAVCPGPVVVDVAVGFAGASGTVVATTGSEAIEGLEVPFALVAVTVYV